MEIEIIYSDPPGNVPCTSIDITNRPVCKIVEIAKGYSKFYVHDVGDQTFLTYFEEDKNVTPAV